MGFADAVKTVFSRYATFSGRAGRPEFWFFALFCFIVNIVIGIIGMFADTVSTILSIIFALGTIIPSIAVGARRLHDTDRSGWWQLIGIVPIVGIIVLIVFYVLKGTDGANRFGAGPDGPVA